MFFLDKEPKITEKEIQILYQTHPYLIEKVFLNQKVVPQYSLPSGFADIVVFLENEIVVVELKVEPLNNNHLLQLIDYINDLKIIVKQTAKVRGVLVGKAPKSDLNNSISSADYEIKMMVLDIDVYTKIKVCKKCRLVNPHIKNVCEFCSSNSFL